MNMRRAPSRSQRQTQRRTNPPPPGNSHPALPIVPPNNERYQPITINQLAKGMFIKYASNLKPTPSIGGFLHSVDNQRRFMLLKNRNSTWSVQLQVPGLRLWVNRNSQNYLQNQPPTNLGMTCRPPL